MFAHLWTASTAMHATDQLTLAALPLIAAARGADAGMISLLVAAHSAAWLLISLPAGALADRFSRRAMMQAGAASTAMGAALLWLALAGAHRQFLLFGAAAFLVSAGIVVIVLSVFALLPVATERKALPRANARIELGRAAVTIVAPPAAAMMVAQAATESLVAIIFACAAAAFFAVSLLPPETRQTGTTASMRQAIAEGARYVVRHPALRAIALCAIFWNIAFFALIALFVPFATERLRFDPAAIGRVWSFYGAGLLIAALTAPAITARVSQKMLLQFGPCVSVLAGALLLLAPVTAPAMLTGSAFFLIGFGPMLWLVTQTTLRQSVTPPELMGRVGATIQVAIYGVRPLGAVLAGAVAARGGIDAAMALPLLCWIVSFAAMAFLIHNALGVMNGPQDPPAA